MKLVRLNSVSGVLHFFTLLFISAVILMPLIVGGIGLRDSWLQTGRDMDLVLKMQADSLRKILSFHMSTVRSISRLPSVNTRDMLQMELDFTYFAQSNPSIESLVYADTAGYPLVRSDWETVGEMEFSISDRRYFIDGTQGREHITGPITSRATGETIMIFSVPLMGDDGFQGLVYETITFDSLRRALTRTPFRSTGRFMLYNADLNAYPAGSIISADQVWEMTECNERCLYFFKDAAGMSWLARGLKIPEYDLILAVRMEFGEFLGPFAGAATLYGGAALVLLMLSFVISRNITREVSSSLKLLLDGVERTAEGEFTPIDESCLERSPLEMKKLGDALNFMGRALKTMTDELEYRSFHDELTGLYNRRFFDDALARFGSDRFNPVTVVMCDVDGLKLINDALGHKAGDDLLKAAAVILRKTARKTDVIARLGGDEFAVIMVEDKDGMGGSRFPEKLTENIAEYKKTPEALPLNISCGVASGHVVTTRIDPLVQKADEEMYAQKNSKRARSRREIEEYLGKNAALTLGNA